MKFLTRLGMIVLNVTGILAGVGPIIGPLITGSAEVVQQAENVFDAIGQIIMQVEVFGQASGLKGPEKLKAATPLVVQALLLYFRARGHKIKDQAMFTQGATDIASGIADCWNAVDDGDLKEQKLG